MTLIGMRNEGRKAEASEGSPAVERLWYMRSPVPTPLGLASQLGWFLEEFHRDGIDVFSLQEKTPTLAPLRSHAEHYVAHSFRQGGSVQAICARASGRRTRLIGLNWVDEYQGILTLPASGITRLRDLRGRRLALPRKISGGIDFLRAGTLRGFIVALELAGLSERDVEFVDVDVVEMARPAGDTPLLHGSYSALRQALVSGEVDVIYAKGAQGVQAADELGARLLLDIRTHPDPLARANHGTPRPLTVDQDLLDLRPDLVARFLARVVDVGDWAVANPAETLAYVARETRTSERYVRLAYGVDLHMRQRTDLLPATVAGLRAYQRFLWERGFIPHDFSIDQWIEPDILERVLRGRRSRVA